MLDVRTKSREMMIVCSGFRMVMWFVCGFEYGLGILSESTSLVEFGKESTY